MANPQLERGFLRVARQIQEALCRFRIPGEARQVFDFILLKTWGWRKKDDYIALSQFCLGTGLRKDKVIRARKKLLTMNLIFISKKGNTRDTTYSINKDFDTWRMVPKKKTFPKKETVISEKGNISYPKKEHTKEKKDTLTKESMSVEKQTDPRIKRILNYFHDIHLKHKNLKPIIDGKCASLAKKLLKAYSEEMVMSLIEKFFDSDDAYVVHQAGYSFGVFYSQAQKLATAKPVGKVNSWAGQEKLG